MAIFMKEQQLSQRPDTLQPPLGAAAASHSRSCPPAETRGHPSVHSMSIYRRGRDETAVSVFCTCRRPVKCTACMLIGVQTEQILRIHHASWGRTDSLEHNLARGLSLAEKGAVACIVLSSHGGFCSCRRSKERQPCQHTSAKHAEFISAARRGAQINKYKSQTHCSGWSSAGGVVVCYCSKTAGLAKLRPFNVD